MSRRLLARMNPHSISPSNINSKTKPLISSSDVAAALAYGNLSKEAYYLGRAKYCDDKISEALLLQHLERKIQYAIQKNNWRDAPGRAKNLAKLVLAEGVYGLTCKRCQGRGYISKQAISNTSDRHARACQSCHGTGFGKFSYDQKAHIINISKSNWARTWEARTLEFIYYVSKLEQELANHLRFQLFCQDSK